MSSIDAASTNDVSSTARSTAATEVGDDESGLLSSPNKRKDGKAPAVTLTSDGIIKECIKQGFYRNPICNEKLYLHNKGYDSIAPTAFELYTDVKVLWLEGNALVALPCGGELIRTRPPRNKSALYSSSSSSSSASSREASPHDSEAGETAAREESKPKNTHVDPFKGLEENNESEKRNESASARRPHRHHTDNLPAASEVPPEDRDAFSSLYPTVRQLYLHNNIFRVMPDLSRFERLDSINLANNFFTKVEPHCPYWDKGVRDWQEAREEEERLALGMAPLKRKSTSEEAGGLGEDEITVVIPSVSACGTKGAKDSSSGHLDDEGEGEEKAPVLSAEELKKRRAEQLAAYAKVVQQFSSFCSHSAIPDTDEINRATLPSRKTVRVARAYRNPCSSLRTLNLAANHLHSFDDLVGLLSYKALNVLDLSQNRIDDGEALLLILEQLKNLKSLKLSGNPLVRSLPKYRKTVLARCPSLMHLDDRPVFPEERRLITAWVTGGEAAEVAERRRIKEENDAAVRKRVDDFRDLLNSYRKGENEKHEKNAQQSTSTAMDPSHTDYVHAVTGVANDGKRKVRHTSAAGFAEGRPNSDPDQSPTSSEEDESDSTQSQHEQPTAIAAAEEPQQSPQPPACAESTAETSTRVLSSNGSNTSPTARERRKADVEVEDEETDDVYIPS